MFPRLIHWLRGAALTALTLLNTCVVVAQPDAPETAAATPTCLDCHARSDEQPIHAVLHSPHGALGSGAPVCTACHGESPAHRRQPLASAPAVSFGPRHASDPDTQNAACTQCHGSGERLFWPGSSHQQAAVRCADCHRAHTRRDAVLNAPGELEVCFDCHQGIRAKVQLPSHHPIGEGHGSCSDCHNPHGASTDAQLRAPTLNDNCYQCHQEKRGPFLFEHAPASEDCALCHDPHGAVNDNLLRVRGPFLCQQCHSAAFHPSQLADGRGLPGASANPSLLGKNCLNCHARIHGSNHPSGARLTR